MFIKWRIRIPTVNKDLHLSIKNRQEQFQEKDLKRSGACLFYVDSSKEKVLFLDSTAREP